MPLLALLLLLLWLTLTGNLVISRKLAQLFYRYGSGLSEQTNIYEDKRNTNAYFVFNVNI